MKQKDLPAGSEFGSCLGNFGQRNERDPCWAHFEVGFYQVLRPYDLPLLIVRFANSLAYRAFPANDDVTIPPILLDAAVCKFRIGPKFIVAVEGRSRLCGNHSLALIYGIIAAQIKVSDDSVIRSQG